LPRGSVPEWNFRADVSGKGKIPAQRHAERAFPIDDLCNRHALRGARDRRGAEKVCGEAGERVGWGVRR
jgi:hypothetical protein